MRHSVRVHDAVPRCAPGLVRPLSSESGAYETVRARFWTWLSGERAQGRFEGLSGENLHTFQGVPSLIGSGIGKVTKLVRSTRKSCKCRQEWRGCLGRAVRVQDSGCRGSGLTPVDGVQGYLAHKKHPPP